MAYIMIGWGESGRMNRWRGEVPFRRLEKRVVDERSVYVEKEPR